MCDNNLRSSINNKIEKYGVYKILVVIDYEQEKRRISVGFDFLGASSSELRVLTPFFSEKLSNYLENKKLPEKFDRGDWGPRFRVLIAITNDKFNFYTEINVYSDDDQHNEPILQFMRELSGELVTGALPENVAEAWLVKNPKKEKEKLH